MSEHDVWGIGEEVRGHAMTPDPLVSPALPEDVEDIVYDLNNCSPARMATVMEQAAKRLAEETRARLQAEQARDKWFIEADRLANGLLETFEEQADPHV